MRLLPWLFGALFLLATPALAGVPAPNAPPTVASAAVLRSTATASFAVGSPITIQPQANGAPALVVVGGTGACATDDGASCINSVDGNHWTGQPTGPWNVLWFTGVDPTGAADSTTGLTNALAAGNTYWPTGAYHVTNALVCHAGKNISTSSPTNSALANGVGDAVLTVGNAAGNDFNMSALGVIIVGNGCHIDGIRFSFYQPSFSGMTISNIIQYPPAIDADGDHAMFFGVSQPLEMDAAWTCIHAGNNSAGSTVAGIIGRVQCSSFGTGLYIDGNTAFVNVRSWDQETFGLTSFQGTVFDASGTSKCLDIGPDDTSVQFGDFLCFGQSVVNEGGDNFSIGGVSFDTLALDSDNATLIAEAGSQTRIGTLYSTKGNLVDNTAGSIQAAGTNTLVTVTNFSMRNSDSGTSGSPVSDIQASNNAHVQLSNGWYYVSGTYTTLAAANDATVTISHAQIILGSVSSSVGNVTAGGTLSLSRDVVTAVASAVGPVILVSGGTAQLNGNTFINPTTMAYPDVTGANATATTLILVGNVFANQSSGQTVVTIGKDLAPNFFSGNTLGYGVVSGLPSTSVLGFYDLPDMPVAITSTPEFKTEGDFAPTGNTVAGVYYWHGSQVCVDHFTDTFTTNAYTTASGVFQFLTNIPGAYAGGNGGTLFLTDLSHATFSGQVISALVDGNQATAPRYTTSTGALTNFGTTQVPASTAGIVFGYSGCYRIRL